MNRFIIVRVQGQSMRGAKNRGNALTLR